LNRGAGGQADPIAHHQALGWPAAVDWREHRAGIQHIWQERGDGGCACYLVDHGECGDTLDERQRGLLLAVL